MFRVYLLWALRMLARPLVAELGVLSVLAVIITSLFSVPSIISNMLGAQSAFSYLLSAFSHSDHIAQLLLIITGATLLYVSRNLAPQRVFKFRFARFA
jgi:hypothetical protein